MRSLLEAALTYAELGVAVFPVGADCRTPLLLPVNGERGTGGVHLASTDPASISEWWRRWPTANIAVACGRASGVFVLDVDCKGGSPGFDSLARLQVDFGPLPVTCRSRTPSGGVHLWFGQPAAVPLRNRVNLTADRDGVRVAYRGLDVRTTGGSVCAPPSRKASGVYAWERSLLEADVAAAPAWLVELIDPPQPVRTGPPATFGTGYGEAALRGEASALAGMGKASGRNQRLFSAAARMGEIAASGGLSLERVRSALADAAQACGLVREDGLRSVHATIASGLRHGTANPRRMRSDLSSELRRREREGRA